MFFDGVVPTHREGDEVARRHVHVQLVLLLEVALQVLEQDGDYVIIEPSNEHLALGWYPGPNVGEVRGTQPPKHLVRDGNETLRVPISGPCCQTGAGIQFRCRCKELRADALFLVVGEMVHLEHLSFRARVEVSGYRRRQHDGRATDLTESRQLTQQPPRRFTLH